MQNSGKHFQMHLFPVKSIDVFVNNYQPNSQSLSMVYNQYVYYKNIKYKNYDLLSTLPRDREKIRLNITHLTLNKASKQIYILQIDILNVKSNFLK